MTAPAADRPWESLPPEVPRVMRPELPALADEIILALREGVPDYARPLEGPFAVGLRAGVEGALRQFVEMIERPRDVPPSRAAYERLGRGEMRAGRTLDALLAAYRLGARVAWRRLAAAGVRAGIAPEVLYRLAESIFAYIDELSAASVEGYATEQSAAAGEAQRLRRRLVALLVHDPPADAVAVEAAAAEAGWSLPRALAAVAFRSEEPERVAGRLGSGAIAAPHGELACALVPDPDGPGRATQLEPVLRELDAAVGPTVAWADAATSFERAAAAWHLAAEGVLPRPGLVRAADHVAALVLHRDRGLVRELAARRLAALDALPRRSREALALTLLAWLAHQGRPKAVAAALHVHEQTVRYRLARLREILGDALEDPDARFELELALRATLGPAGGAQRAAKGTTAMTA
jgi:hypothetical protein